MIKIKDNVTKDEVTISEDELVDYINMNMQEINMIHFTKEMVDSYADKLLIGLTAEENKMVLDEFAEIDRNINIINAIPNIKDVEPMSYCLDNMECCLNDDEAEETVPIEELLRNSGKKIGREVEVVKVVGENV